MNIFSLRRKNNPNDIYFFRPDRAIVDISSVFGFFNEGSKLRVKNDYVNCLFRNLTVSSFHNVHNKFRQYLNLNFEPILIDNVSYSLTATEQDRLEQEIIMFWIYYFTINGMRVKIRRSDFTHPYTIDKVIWMLDPKFGVNSEIGVKIGAHILRRDFEHYSRAVQARRTYYQMK